jgi:hypothetical protein
LKVDLEDVKPVLRRLAKTGVVEKGRATRNTENLYWLSKFQFQPSRNVTGEVLTIPVRISQIEASKRARSMLEGGFFGKKEEIYDMDFSHLPIWRIYASREVKKLLLIKKEEFDTYYMSVTGAVVSLEKRHIAFQKLVAKDAEKLKDLDDDRNIVFIPKLPSEVEGFPQLKTGVNKLYRKLQLKLGVKPVSAEIILLPVWTLKIRHKKTLATRVIKLDAATGRILSGKI